MSRDRLARVWSLVDAEPPPVDAGGRTEPWLKRLCSAAIRALPACGAGVTVQTADGALGVAAASDPASAALEDTQFALPAPIAALTFRFVAVRMRVEEPFRQRGARVGGEWAMPGVAADRLATVFVEVADTLIDEFDVVDFLHMVTCRTVELADVTAAGLLLANHHGELQFVTASDERTELLELFQLQGHEGPCLDCHRTGVPVTYADLTSTTTPWPAFTQRALAADFRSVHAVPLRLRDETIGALNLFGATSGSLAPQEGSIVQALADVATIALLQERTIGQREVLAQQLQGALNSRVVIEQAKGVVAQTHGVSIDDAFVLLRDHARRSRRLLSDVAHLVVTDPTSLADVASERVRPR